MAFYMTIENSVKDAITRDLNTKPWLSSKMRISLWKNINKKLNQCMPNYPLSIIKTCLPTLAQLMPCGANL